MFFQCKDQWPQIFLVWLHPGRLTWNIIMEVWKTMFLSKWVICRFQPLIFQPCGCTLSITKLFPQFWGYCLSSWMSFLAIPFCHVRCHTQHLLRLWSWNWHAPGSIHSLYWGWSGHPTFNRNPYNGYINPYYWVDDHPLLYGNNGSLDPSTHVGWLEGFTTQWLPNPEWSLKKNPHDDLSCLATAKTHIALQ